MTEKKEAVFTFDGDFIWEGITEQEDGQRYGFIVAGDDFADAVSKIDPDMPGIVISLARGKNVAGVEIPLPEGFMDKMDEAKKRGLN